jgi:hypothetical protein
MLQERCRTLDQLSLSVQPPDTLSMRTRYNTAADHYRSVKRANCLKLGCVQALTLVQPYQSGRVTQRCLRQARGRSHIMQDRSPANCWELREPVQESPGRPTRTPRKMKPEIVSPHRYALIAMAMSLQAALWSIRTSWIPSAISA